MLFGRSDRQLLRAGDAPLAKLFVTGFGPFPGARKNPTEALIAALADEPAETVGAGALRAAVLPTDYRRSWLMLQRLYAGEAPDVVVHFGLSLRSEAIHVERVARNAANPAKRDVTGYQRASKRVTRAGPDRLHATLPVSAIVEALTAAGFPALLSDDAGGYVCNATLYRSLLVEAAPRIGFVHVPPTGKGGLTAERLLEAARVVLRSAVASHGVAASAA